MKKILFLLLILTSCQPLHIVLDQPVLQGDRAIGWQTQRAKMDFRDSTKFQKIAKLLDGVKIGDDVSGSDIVVLDSVTTDGTSIYFYSGATILTAVPGVGSAAWGSISGTLTNQVDLTTALGLKANLASPTFTGTVAGITAAMTGAMATSHAANAITGTNISNWNTAYGWGNPSGLYAALVHGHVQTSIVGLPDSLLARYTKAQANTLLNLKANTTALAGYVPTSRTVNGHALTGNVSVTAADVSLGNVTNESKATMFTNAALTGVPTAPTAVAGTNTTQIATTAFVKAGLDLKPNIADSINLYTAMDTSAVIATKYDLDTFTTAFVNAGLHNYYVSNDGNDGSDGLTPATAWLTVAKVNGSTFLPGSRINFNKGDVWRETLIIPSSGSETNPITFGSYGTGVAPIIQPTEQVTSWTQVGATDVWYGTLTTAPSQIFISDVYVQPAHWPTTVGADPAVFGYPSGNSADATHLTDTDFNGMVEADLVGSQVNIYNVGARLRQAAISAFDDGTDIITIASVTNNPLTTDPYYLTAPSGAGISFASKDWMMTENTWFYDDDANRIYVWKTGGGNPGTAEASTGTNGIYSDDKSYITIDGLHLRYAKETGISCNVSDADVNNIIIQNCTIDYNGVMGIWLGRIFGSTKVLTGMNVNNNTLDHNLNNGMIISHVSGTSITDNNITYTGGLYPQLPWGEVATSVAGIFLSEDAGTFLIDNNTINYTSQNGIYFSGCPDGTISNNTISNTSIYLTDSGGTYTAQTSTDLTITGNTLTNTGNGFYFDEISQGGIVEHNIVNGGICAVLLHRAFDITIRYNEFTGPFTTTYGILMLNNHATTSTGLAFQYNIIDGVDKSNAGILIGGNSSLTNALIDIQNNIIMNCEVGVEEYQEYASEIDDIEYNIFYNNTTHIQAVASAAVSIDYNLYYGSGNWDWDHSAQATFELWKTASSLDVNSSDVFSFQAIMLLIRILGIK